jgi:serine/threonine-protein kinase
VVKLADFGIAKATEQSSITQAGSVLGTAAYLAPEQARGEEAGPLADQYALGVVTYQMLAGRLPYEATSLTELAFKQQREPPAVLEELNPHVPVALAHAVAQSMALDPGARYPGALAMGEALRAGEQGIEPAVAGPGEDATPATVMLDRDQPPTDATHALPPRPATEGRRPMQPRPGPPPPPEPPRMPAPPRQAPSRAGRILRRILVLVVLIALIVLGVVLLTDSLSNNPRLHRVTGHTVSQTVDDLKNLIDDNRR